MKSNFLDLTIAAAGLNISAMDMVISDHKWLNSTFFMFPTVKCPEHIVSYRNLKGWSFPLSRENCTTIFETYDRGESFQHFLETSIILLLKWLLAKKHLYMLGQISQFALHSGRPANDQQRHSVEPLWLSWARSIWFWSFIHHHCRNGKDVELESLQSSCKLTGYLRFFHPEQPFTRPLHLEFLLKPKRLSFLNLRKCKKWQTAFAESSLKWKAQFSSTRLVEASEWTWKILCGSWDSNSKLPLHLEPIPNTKTTK